MERSKMWALRPQRGFAVAARVNGNPVRVGDDGLLKNGMGHTLVCAQKCRLTRLEPYYGKCAFVDVPSDHPSWSHLERVESFIPQKA